MTKNFDLNIEKILDHWEPCHAIREIIANALDEQILSNSKDVEVFKKGSSWYIRDYGRGLKYTNLTLNENPEKLKSNNVIGKFGIGLKDALATFDKYNNKVSVTSKHTVLTFGKFPKAGFDTITLHALVDDPTDRKFSGTLFTLGGIKDQDMEKAKKLFLKFSEEEILETTKIGQIIQKKELFGNIYINGVKVAEEENFLFSYNITSTNASIKKALNRERTNVGRSAYKDSVEKILLSSKNANIASIMGKDLQSYNEGTNSDELSWTEVQEHTVTILNASKKCLFLSADEIANHPDMVDEARENNFEIVLIPGKLRDKISDKNDITGKPVMGLGQFVDSYNESFAYSFIGVNQLSDPEKKIFSYTNKILNLIGGMPRQVKHVKISSTMRKDFSSNSQTQGVWDEELRSIIILQSQLKNLSAYSGTLIHEAIHAKSGFGDVTRDFECELTEAIGLICASSMKKQPS